MFALLGLIPGAMSLIQFVVGKYKDAQVQITMAQLSCDRDKAVALITERQSATHDGILRLQAIAGSKLLTWLTIAFATPLLLYEWRVIVHDIILQLGSTDPIRGQVADWASAIIYSIFGSAAAVKVLGK
jgi:hypothetical protein